MTWSSLPASPDPADRNPEARTARRLACHPASTAVWRTDHQADAIEVARTTLRETPHGPLADRMRILHCTVFGHTRDAADASHDGSEEGAEVGLSELTAEQQQQMEENPDAIRAPEKIFSPAPPYTKAARRERV